MQGPIFALQLCSLGDQLHWCLNSELLIIATLFDACVRKRRLLLLPGCVNSS